MTKMIKSILLGLITMTLNIVPGRCAELTTTGDDEKVLRAQATAYSTAFAKGDAAAIANMWTEDGTYVSSDGTELRGRAAIEKLFASGFKLGAQPLEVSIESIEFPASNVAIEKGTTRLLKGPSAGSLSRYIVVHVKKDGAWHMDAVSEVDCAPPTSVTNLLDMSWLLGNWSAVSAQGVPIRLNVDWTQNHKFLRCSFAVDNATGSPGQMQMIGWNPLSGRPVSWHFDSKGGFGYGRWYKDGQSWIEKASGVQADGTTTYAKYVLTKLNDNSFTWQSKDRRCAGSSIPDTAQITVTRDLSATK